MNLREPYVQKGLGAIVLVIALVWVVFLTDYLPFSYKRNAAELEKRRNELQRVTSELQRLKSAAENLPQMKKELATIMSKWEALRELLPKESEMSTLLGEVTTAGLKAGIQFTLFQPLEPERLELFTKHPIKLSVVGTYHQVGNFFNNLCNMERLVDISNVKITQVSGGEQAVTVEATATISAYTYNPDSKTPRTTGNKPKKG